MFKAEINVGGVIDCIEPIIAIVDKGILDIGADGWKVRLFDPANVAVISINLQSDAFDKFEFEPKESEDRIKIGLNFRHLVGMLRLWEPEKTAELKLDGDAKKLFVKSDVFNYSVSLLEVSSLLREKKIPKLKFPVHVIVETEEFKRAVHAMERLGDTVTVGVEGEQFYMEAEDESGVLRAGLRKVFPVKKEAGNFHSRYFLDYLTAMCNGMTYTKNLTLSFGTDYPIQIDFKEGVGKKKVRYLLAPRISE